MAVPNGGGCLCVVVLSLLVSSYLMLALIIPPIGGLHVFYGGSSLALISIVSTIGFLTLSRRVGFVCPVFWLVRSRRRIVLVVN